jgi:predicted GNAT family N-acyltransferase
MKGSQNQIEPQQTNSIARASIASPPIRVRRLVPAELPLCWQLTRHLMEGDLADDTVVRRVQEHNSDSIWGIFENLTDDREGEMVGYYSFLMLNRRGADFLFARTLDVSDPPLEGLARAGERPAIVYMWAVVAPKMTIVAFPMIAAAAGPLYSGVPTYARAGTPQGVVKLQRTAHPVDPHDTGLGALFRTDRHFDPEAVASPAMHRMRSRFKIVVASNADEIAKVNAVRAVFVHEQDCPFDEEFDGNDFTATHILAYVDGEPAAVMRIRYFADFVKLERLAVLKRYRATLIKREIVHFAINFCRRKGYRKAYGHSQRQHARFWAHFGFKELPRDKELVFSDHGYIEMYGDLHPHSMPLSLATDPYVLLRPEGRWDEPGILEVSAGRKPKEAGRAA